ncbi:MAG: ADP-ribosylglycohydrolase family protein [Bacillota bacterium]|nr:ADP-ribosylglycohydrolase family protein [Bacillota bacterium]
MKRSRQFFRGCLVGGALGDALGWPVEFLTREDIKYTYGDGGITDIIPGLTGIGEITDDTQMALFTAEGILRAEAAAREKGTCVIYDIVYDAYQRWLYTQSQEISSRIPFNYDGWLIDVRGLHARRAPGMSCISALARGVKGTIEAPVNNSKGCGGVMRTAPVGLFYEKEQAFKIAADIAAITHGHPLGYLPAGALAAIIASIIEGMELEAAVQWAVGELKKYDGYEGCTRLMDEAVRLASSEVKVEDAIKELGEGWVGEEALAISIYCALKFKGDFKGALFAAVNHDGDSDSTGAITGNILGAYLGMEGIPKDWMKKVELMDVIIEAADDLLTGYRKDEAWLSKYPVH